MRFLILLLAGLLWSNVAAAQGKWMFTQGGEGPKFGWVAEAGSNNFFPLWIYCEADTKRIMANAYVGDRRPADGRGNFTLTISGQPPVTVAGDVASDTFDGLYTMDTQVTRDHPLFAALAKGQPMAYAGGSTRADLGAAGLTATLQQWLSACR